MSNEEENKFKKDEDNFINGFTNNFVGIIK